MKPQSGLTLLELLIATAILTILLSFGVPGFSHLRQKQAADTTIEQLQQAINSARQAALSKRSPVVICAANSSADACADSADWSQGTIILLADRSNDHPTLLTHQQYAGRNHGQILVNTRRKRIAFNAAGFTADMGSLTYCPQSGERRYQRKLTVTLSGRVKRSTDISSCP